MLLRNRVNDYRTLLAIGQLSLVAGLVGQRFIHPAGDFWQGFVMGFCGVLIGVSIICNTCGLVRWRRAREAGA